MFEPESSGQRWWLRASTQDAWGEISATNRFRWVAANGDGIFASAEQLEEVLAQAEEEEVSWDDIAFAFIDGQELEPGS